MNILALDLGTKTGWALCVDGQMESGVQVFDVKRGESPGMRYRHFRQWLSGLMWEKTGRVIHIGFAEEVRSVFDVVVYEQTHQRGGAATEVAAGFATRVQEACAEPINGKPDHAAVHSATLKKSATGNGRAGKLQMIERAVQLSDDFAARYGAWAKERKATAAQVEGAWSDEADAICLLHYALDMLKPGELAPDSQ